MPRLFTSLKPIHKVLLVLMAIGIFSACKVQMISPKKSNLLFMQSAGSIMWSPDATKLAFSYTNNRPGGDVGSGSTQNFLYIIKIDGTDLKLIAKDPPVFRKWHPDSQGFLAAEYNEGIFIIDQEGKKEILLDIKDVSRPNYSNNLDYVLFDVFPVSPDPPQLLCISQVDRYLINLKTEKRVKLSYNIINQLTPITNVFWTPVPGRVYLNNVRCEEASYTEIHAIGDLNFETGAVENITIFRQHPHSPISFPDSAYYPPLTILGWKDNDTLLYLFDQGETDIPIFAHNVLNGDIQSLGTVPRLRSYYTSNVRSQQVSPDLSEVAFIKGNYITISDLNGNNEREVFDYTTLPKGAGIPFRF